MPNKFRALELVTAWAVSEDGVVLKAIATQSHSDAHHELVESCVGVGSERIDRGLFIRWAI
jgi:hypothetical protein